jgi:hypothetical protein
MSKAKAEPAKLDAWQTMEIMKSDVKGEIREMRASFHEDARTVGNMELPKLAVLSNLLHARVIKAHLDALGCAVTAGATLAAARARCKADGEPWLPWLATNFEGSKSTAYDYIQAAEYFQRAGSLPENVSSLRELLKAVRDERRPAAPVDVDPPATPAPTPATPTEPKPAAAKASNAEPDADEPTAQLSGCPKLFALLESETDELPKLYVDRVVAVLADIRTRSLIAEHRKKLIEELSTTLRGLVEVERTRSHEESLQAIQRAREKRAAAYEALSDDEKRAHDAEEARLDAEWEAEEERQQAEWEADDDWLAEQDDETRARVERLMNPFGE